MRISIAGPALFLATTISQALAQGPDDITQESANVCGFTIKTSSGPLERTDSYDIVPATKETIWPVSQFFITNGTLGHLYAAGNGDRCGFDPQFQCLNTSKAITSSKSPFTISANSSLLYAGQALFSICHNKTAPTSSSLDTPYIFPLNGETSAYTNCSITSLMATSCQNASQYTSHPSTAATQTQGDTGSTATASSDSNQNQPSTLMSAGSALFFVGIFMAFL